MLARLKSLLPADVGDVANLADTLYAAGQQDAAAVFYEMALAQEGAGDKAWFCFQAANCKQKLDPAAAAKLYGRVQAEFPSSPWAPLAATKARLVEWIRQSVPESAVADQHSLRDGRPPAEGPASPEK